ncbi:hypothetical protein E5D57_013415 [Metarhizium anisopliae]|nr:hypothetical protein E5D57_013415 [Metarhizium anisopliae]
MKVSRPPYSHGLLLPSNLDHNSNPPRVTRDNQPPRPHLKKTVSDVASLATQQIFPNAQHAPKEYTACYTDS